MRVRMQVKLIEEKRILLIHFIDRPNIRGEKFKIFVEKLEKALNRPLQGVKIVLLPKPLQDPMDLEINWSRFDNCGFLLKDFIKF